MAEHFNTAGHSIHHALVRGIMLCGENVQRKRREMRLIFQPGTSHPRGLTAPTSVSSRPRAERAHNKVCLFVFSFMAYANIATFPTYYATPLMKGQGPVSRKAR